MNIKQAVKNSPHFIPMLFCFQAKYDQRKKDKLLPFSMEDNVKTSDYSNGYVPSSLLLQNGFSNGVNQNHFFLGSTSPSKSKQPASVTRKFNQQAI